MFTDFILWASWILFIWITLRTSWTLLVWIILRTSWTLLVWIILRASWALFHIILLSSRCSRHVKWNRNNILLRMLFKSKTYINMKQKTIKNLVIKFKNNRNCWNYEELHFLIDCSDFSKKKKWIKKKFKQKIINLKKIDVSKSNIQMINLIKILLNNVDEINEFDSDVKRASKN